MTLDLNQIPPQFLLFVIGVMIFYIILREINIRRKISVDEYEPIPIKKKRFDFSRSKSNGTKRSRICKLF